MSSAADDKDKKSCPVQVLVRCRPPNAKETGHPLIVQTNQTRKEVDVLQQTNGKPYSRTFIFDQVYGQNSTQEEVFNKSIVPIVEEVLLGYNCTIFAYGQTSTGKTYTMEGDWSICSQSSEPATSSSCDSSAASLVLNSNAGVIPRAVHSIFSTLESQNSEYSVKVSCLELYNEELVDLLTNQKRPGPLRIFEDVSGKHGTVVSNLEELPVHTALDILNILDEARKRRRFAETQMNAHSSRSHVITSITIHMKECTPDGEDLIKIGKLNLVDLAGSESIGRSGAINQRAKEAGMINTSLLTLGRVINALTDHCVHIPYRESKLTRLLRDSLGGHTKTCIIATISPSFLNLEETMGTLDYAYRAKNIRNRPELNQKMTKRTLIKEMNGEIERLKVELQANREKNGVFLPPDIYDEQISTIERQGKRISDIETELAMRIEELEETKRLFETKSNELDRESRAHASTRIDLDMTRSDLCQTKGTLMEREYVLNEHQRTGAQLSQEAEEVLCRLRVSVDDLSALYGKIDRKTTVERDNSRLADSFRTELHTRFEQLEKSFSTFQHQQRDTHQQYHSMIASMLSEKAHGLQALRSTMESFVALITRSSGELDRLVQDHVQGAQTHLKQEAAIEQQSATAISTILSDLAATLSPKMSELATRIDEIDANVHRLESEFEVAHQSELRSVDDFVANHSSQLRELHRIMSDSSAQTVSALSASKEDMGLILSRQQEQNAAFRQSVLDQITTLLDTHIQHQDATFKEATESVVSRLNQAVVSTGEYSRQYDIASTQLADSVSHFDSETLRPQRKAARLMIQQHAGSTRKLTSDIRSVSLSGITSTFDQHSERIRQRIDASRLQTEEHVSQGRTENETFLNAHSSRVGELSAAVTQQHSAMEQIASSTFDTTMQDRCESLSGSLRDGEQHIEQHLREQTASIQDTKRGVDAYFSHIRTDTPTGATPIKKVVPIPQRLPIVRAYDEIALEFHQSQGREISVPTATAILPSRIPALKPSNQRPGHSLPGSFPKSRKRHAPLSFDLDDDPPKLADKENCVPLQSHPN